ncbi:MAG: DUF4091 domain-containing protein [Planctomycetota bacterium]|nr:DUF4091 domain-containing protein [Planctomycetota bacterium]
MTLSAQLTSSLQRHFPLSRLGPARALRLHVARGEKASLQAAFAHPGPDPIEVAASAKATGGIRATVRRVGVVPVPHFNTHTPVDERDGVGFLPGYAPDPLFPETAARFAPEQTHAFWITLDVPPDAKPGPQTVTVELKPSKGSPVKLEATLLVSKVVLKRRQNFDMVHWFYADALCDWYKVSPWEEAFWPIVEKYMRNYAGHGLNGIYVPVFTPPLDGVKRPTQLLGVKRTGKDKYAFDWTNVKRWITTAKAAGLDRWEWTHLFTQWGVRSGIRIYEKRYGEDALLWPPETGATSDTYRKFLSQFLPQFHRFLSAEKLLGQSYFHVSDEPHGDEHLANYRAARGLLKELAPWMKVMDALSDIRYGKEGLTDLPIPSISTTLEYVEAGIPCWTYYCCGPRGRFLNRLIDTPLAKIRMNGWLFHRWPVTGFLHWGYNYWYKSQTRQLIDPFVVTDGQAWPGWAHGDPFVVYPGTAEQGPIDSIRWEIFAESMQDYALLQTLGVERNDKRLASLKSFEDFPKSAAWIQETRAKLLAKG